MFFISHKIRKELRSSLGSRTLRRRGTKKRGAERCSTKLKRKILEYKNQCQ